MKIEAALARLKEYHAVINAHAMRSCRVKTRRVALICSHIFYRFVSRSRSWKPKSGLYFGPFSFIDTLWLCVRCGIK